MGYPSFSVGDVLTASDMNAVGLWRITTGITATNGTVSDGVVTVGNAVSSVTISGCFSSAYINYRIVYSNLDFSNSDSSFFVRPGSVATGNVYSSGGLFVLYTGLGPGYLASSATNDGIAIGITSTDSASGAFDIYGPHATTWTRASGHWTGDLYTGTYGGVMKNTTSYTSLELRPAVGTMTGGTIRVYGYKN